jgi:3-deoxy-D-manno-octulosonic-acid transferase
MSRIIFIFLLFVAALIRGPLSLLLIILKNLSRPLKKRIDFERKNLSQEQCRSFRLDYKVADYCFEVSSEGELEQVRPLIEYYLKHHKRIEILFASPSVEAKCLKLALDFKDQIRIMRLPIASFAPVSFLFFQSPWSWVSAPVIVFCRYDFFPELLSFKFFNKKLILLSGASKRPSWFKTQSHALFSMIVAANETEARYFRENTKAAIDIKVMAFDFRVPRIFERLEMAPQTLQAVSELSSYLNYLDSLNPSQKLILGSAWESDLVIFKNDSQKWTDQVLAKTMHILIVPHKLNSESIIQLKKSLASIMPAVPIYEISKGTSFDASILITKPGIVVLNLSGILCELYSKFSFAYVGGGYERSIHSVLEPFLSGCQVAMGPKISRSTEFDYILEIAPNEIHLLKNAESFYNLVKENASKTPVESIRTNLSKEVHDLMESIIKEIELC